jgi:CheY-like chemotaxis protein
VNVLVVDADEATRQDLVMALEALGHHAVGCPSGSKALSEAFKAEFDLAICDVDMPDIPGAEVVRALKTQAPGLVAWMLGAREPSTWSADAAEAGVARCLPKPLHHHTLRAELETLLGVSANVDVVVASPDRHHARELLEPFRRARWNVTEVNRIAEFLMRLGERGADVVVVDGSLPFAHIAVTTCALRPIPCIVLDDNPHSDAAAAGPTVLLGRQTSPDQLLSQARALTQRL